MGRAILVGFALVGVLLIGCSRSAQSTSQTTTGAVSIASGAPAATESASPTPTPVPTTPAMLTPPAGWNAVTPPAGALGAWARPGNQATVQNVSLSGGPFAGTLADYVAVQSKEEERGLTDVAVAAAQDIFVCKGRPARLLKWSGTETGQMYRFVQVYAVFDTSGPTGYVATYTRSDGEMELPEAVVALETLCPL